MLLFQALVHVRNNNNYPSFLSGLSQCSFLSFIVYRSLVFCNHTCFNLSFPLKAANHLIHHQKRCVKWNLLGRKMVRLFWSLMRQIMDEPAERRRIINWMAWLSVMWEIYLYWPRIEGLSLLNVNVLFMRFIFSSIPKYTGNILFVHVLFISAILPLPNCIINVVWRRDFFLFSWLKEIFKLFSVKFFDG